MCHQGRSAQKGQSGQPLRPSVPVPSPRPFLVSLLCGTGLHTTVGVTDCARRVPECSVLPLQGPEGPGVETKWQSSPDPWQASPRRPSSARRPRPAPAALSGAAQPSGAPAGRAAPAGGGRPRSPLRAPALLLPPPSSPVC